MLNGLYGSAAALDALTRLQESTASNLAHLNTPGHRRLLSGFSELIDPQGSGEARPGAIVGEQQADFSPGRLEQTERSLDMALQGDAFFVFQGAHGLMYSRNGVLFRNPDSNQLVNGDGFPILDNNQQPITFDGPLDELSIGSDGAMVRKGQPIGKLGVVEFDDNSLLESENQTYFRAGSATVAPAEEFRVVQGFRELSNASPVTELISLIVCSRHFEASQRAIRAISDALQANTRS